jgi:stage III sporulation protein SpoIIIAA
MSPLGLESTLHRVGRMASAAGDTNPVTVRVGKAFVGLAEPLPEDGVSILGRPSSGKTALLRDRLRILRQLKRGNVHTVDAL